MSWIYKLLIAGLLCAVVYLGFNVFRFKKLVKQQTEVLIKQKLESIKSRDLLIDSLMNSKIVITKELLKNSSYIEKLKKELDKNQNSEMSLEEAKRILGL